MSNDDQTMQLPDESKYDTKPGITAVLERINELGNKLSGEISGLRSEFGNKLSSEISALRTELGDRLSGEISALRTEMQTGFKRLDQKIDLVHKDMLELRTDHKLLEQRMDDLERKAS